MIEDENRIKMDSVERRTFLKYGFVISGAFLGGSLLSLTSVRKAMGALQGIGVVGLYHYEPHYSMVVQQANCIGCQRCVTACGKVNHVPSFGKRIAVLQRNGANSQEEFLPVLCNQCNRPPCVKVCPTKATYKDKKTGLVLMNDKLCIGCKACMTSCPYNARFYNDEKKAVDKCDFCYASRLKKGETVPACVEACPNNVFIFGDLNNQEGEVHKLVHEIHKTVWVLRPEKGTMPNIFYLKN